MTPLLRLQHVGLRSAGRQDTSPLGSLPSPCHGKHLLYILGYGCGQVVLVHILRLGPPKVLAPTNLVMQGDLQHTPVMLSLCAGQGQADVSSRQTWTFLLCGGSLRAQDATASGLIHAAHGLFGDRSGHEHVLAETCSQLGRRGIVVHTSKSQHRMTGLGAGCFSFSGWPSFSRPSSAPAGCRGFKAL